MNTDVRQGRSWLLLVYALALMPGLARAQGDLLPAFEMRDFPVGLILPGDFNRDGRVDLIGSPVLSDIGPPTDLLLFIRTADGAFAAPRSLGLTARPLAVADLNSDARLDIVVRTTTGLAVLPGNGNGTFGSPRIVETYGEYNSTIAAFALVADYTGDGALDIAVPFDEFATGGRYLQIHPGAGSFSFGTPLHVPTPDFAARGVTADINGDGLPDVALAPYSGSLTVLVNTGQAFFREYTIENHDYVGDVALGDLNGDDILDLIFATSVEYSQFDEGEVVVRLGLGAGGFAAETRFDAGARNEYRLAIGDFTRDGILDVATSNLSARSDDHVGVVDWDSVSIMRGDGTGRLEPAVSFMLGRFPGPGEFHRQTHLAAADMNADGHLDLLASPGTILFNRPPAANRPPVVFAGPDFTRGPGDQLPLDGEAWDVDGHTLTYRWTDSDGTVISPGTGPKALLVLEPPPGAYTFTLTVDDGHGGVVSDSVTVTFLSAQTNLAVIRPNEQTRLREDEAFTIQWVGAEAADRFDVEYSVDNGRTFDPVSGCSGLGPGVQRCIWNHPNPRTAMGIVRVTAIDVGGETAVALSQRFAIDESSGESELPSGWRSQDVGAVAAVGSATGDGLAFTIRGSGADIWGTADEFHGIFAPAPAPSFEVTVRVRSVQHVDQWTKAGLMVRSHLGPSASHASLFVTPTTVKGVAFQRRREDNAASVHTSGPKMVAPIWLKLVVTGDTVLREVRAFYRDDAGGPWVLIGRDSVVLPYPAEVAVVVGSHRDGVLASASFDNLSLRTVPTWGNVDIGQVGRPGTTVDDGATVTMEGSGADIWGTADAFRFHFTGSLAADLRISARVHGIEATHQWAKAGVMMRESLDPGARHVMLIVSPGRGVAMQYRGATNGPSANVAVVSGSAPAWLRLTRHGDRIVGEMSSDGLTWATVGAVDLPFPGVFRPLAGVAVTSHNNGTLATAVLDSVELDEDVISLP
jgi:hypothetical protein